MSGILKLGIKPLREGITLPKYALEGDACMDLYIPEGVTYLLDDSPTLIPLGFALQIPKGWEVQIRPKSGLALKYNVQVVNSPGTIDSNYTGEVGVIATGDHYYAEGGTKIAQMTVRKVPTIELYEVSQLQETNRGSGGFGSTGV